MRILVCYPWLELGGAPKTSITLAKGLKERGHEVFFFSKKGGMYEELLESTGIPLISAPYHSFLPQMFHLNFKAFRILKRTIEQYNIDIIHSFHPIPYFLSLFIAPLKNIPVILTAVWFLDRWPFPAYPGRVTFVAGEFMDQSEPFLGKYLRDRIVIPNRVDLDRFSKDVDWSDFAQIHSLPEAGTKIAFMSRLGHTKENSVFYSMDAIDILVERGVKVSLVIAGDGPSYHKLVDHAKMINLKHSREIVYFIGSTTRTPELMSWSDIVIGIGRSAFEGMATSKPTLIVGENGLAGVVRRDTVTDLQYYNFAGRNIKTPRDASLLADTIQEIMNDKNKYKDLSAFAREYVIDNYDYRKGAAKLELIYEQALREQPLNSYEKARVLVTDVVNGYCRRAYIAFRAMLSGIFKKDSSINTSVDS